MNIFSDLSWLMYRCVDYIQIRSNSGSMIKEICGTDTTGVNGIIFPFGNLLSVIDK